MATLKRRGASQASSSRWPLPVLCVVALVSKPSMAAPDCGRLEDIGAWRVGAELGELRTGFSGRIKVTVFTSPTDPNWPAIAECLVDPILETDMAFFVGVLVDETLDTETESVMRERGFRVVIRPLGGAMLGALESGFTCLDLLRVMQNARLFEGTPRPSPIYSSLLEDPTSIEPVVAQFGCERAAGFASLLEEFEGSESPVVKTVRERLALACEIFLRGDANDDGTLDISDPIATLGFLFLGEPASICGDAADSNDDGRVDVSDPLHALTYLFSCGLPPAMPFPFEGTDPTEDVTGCERGES